MSLETKLIIFDLGGVVVPECGDAIKTQIANTIGIKSKELDELSKQSFGEVTSGVKNLLQFYTEILKQMEIDRDPHILLKAHLDAYEQYVEEPNPRMLTLINNLKKHYHVACLTNTEHEITQLNRERELFEIFEPHIFLSCEMGLRKPQPKIYQKVLEETKSEPTESLFIDNNQEYISGAEKLGIPSILFQNLYQLYREFKGLGINYS